MTKNTGRQVLFIKADESTPRNGEGTFLRLADGRIMFAYSRFAGEAWYDECSADIAAVFSSDEGEAWTSPAVIIKHDEKARNLMCPSLLRLPDGRIALIYLRKDKETINAVPYICFSDDECTSFTHPHPIINDDKNYYVIVNDHAVVLSDGRIILPVNLHSECINGEYTIVEHGRKCVFASDDNGKTWKEIAQRQDTPFPDASETGLQETCIYEQSDGTLRAFSRTDLGFHFECFSTDKGSRWTSPVPNRFFSAPDSPLLMKRAGSFTLAVFNPIPNYTTRDAESSWGRSPLVCAVSKNDGRSFRAILTIEDDPENGYCYPAIFDGGDYILLAYYHSDNTGTPLTATKIKKISYDELESWRVTFSGGFSENKREKKGEKITINKTFCFGGHEWLIPAAYICPKGIVLDVFAKIDNTTVKEFISSLDMTRYDESRISPAEKNPFDISFRSALVINGKAYHSKTGCSVNWIPAGILPDGEEPSEEAKRLMEYYELDKESSWSLHRISFPCKVRSLPSDTRFAAKSHPQDTPVLSFKNPSQGDKFTLTHPEAGKEYVLTINSCENAETGIKENEEYTFPSHFVRLSYSTQPQLTNEEFVIKENGRNASPVKKEGSTHADTSSAIAIIGGADGPTAVFLCEKGSNSQAQATSSLQYEALQNTEWTAYFRKKSCIDTPLF